MAGRLQIAPADLGLSRRPHSRHQIIDAGIVITENGEPVSLADRHPHLLQLHLDPCRGSPDPEPEAMLPFIRPAEQDGRRRIGKPGKAGVLGDPLIAAAVTDGHIAQAR